MNRSFNEVVCVDHLHLNEHRVMHIMESAMRFSAGDVVEGTSTINAIQVIECQWITPFWNPDTVLFDPAVEN